MATCNSCGATASRTRTMVRKGQLVDECPNCAPQTFEKATAPSENKIWIGPEYNPNAYVKKYDEHGEMYYEAKPEFTAEQEAKIVNADGDAELAAKKRATRRTEPMNKSELERAMAQARSVAAQLQSEFEERARAQVNNETYHSDYIN